MTEQERSASDATELEGGGTEQTWGQGEGAHEPTIPDEDAGDEEAATYAAGTAADLDDPDLPLAREDEEMAR
jgi:hypothetical protein